VAEENSYISKDVKCAKPGWLMLREIRKEAVDLENTMYTEFYRNFLFAIQMRKIDVGGVKKIYFATSLKDDYLLMERKEQQDKNIFITRGYFPRLRK